MTLFPHARKNKKTKKMYTHLSWNGIKPSEDFDEEQYNRFLEYAAPHELEGDYIHSAELWWKCINYPGSYGQVTGQYTQSYSCKYWNYIR